ncbi:uncharacterized protein PHACADRAFT_254770 [Phanerochaete carnosa HHB-10118-sp]|uniref:Uncharacterized protein n=1 Tax=Phanerochaete carnosa (strain HHB-10118-sp) TaxID=650164 RepID=K5X2Z7_PHACS|nr:uncharacterized protein PHACADRAFT_254770 [Phanerochaete carnosa HHB-10118-sp]EKM57182.1 hypothetical protein PHACADRAFT_254770 [Phanerochaete carnosa HHB-10118-sp]
MYKLIRRISSTFLPRPDRPWNDDATSNAPQIGKKRRMSDDEEVPAPASMKKHRTGLRAEDTVILEEPSEETQEQEGTTDGVKEVTEGVREVELEDNTEADASEEPVTTETAAAVPLPDSPVLEAQTETIESVSPEALAEVKAEAAEHPEDSTMEPAASEAGEEKAVEKTGTDTAEGIATSDATSTAGFDVATHATTYETALEGEKAREAATEVA